ncbi:MAG: hypothetical protein KAX20_08215 [Candidatus Omnitrophica bacterium]|nr:hypothetical protein [Candidatus Omnitrophota bacterium]
MSKKLKPLVSIVLVTLMLMSVFIGTAGAVATKPGELHVSPTSWNPSFFAGDSKSKEFSVRNDAFYCEYCVEKAYPEPLKGVKVEKISGPDWLTFATPTDLGDIPTVQSRKFILRASPPEDAEGTFPYKIRVSCTSGEPSYIDVEGKITVKSPPTKPGELDVYPTSWNPSISAGDSKSKEVSVRNDAFYCEYCVEKAYPEPLKGVKVEKISGPDWLTFATPTDLGDIPTVQSRKFTIGASPPADTDKGAVPYKIRVSCTSGEPSYIDITGKITVTPLVTAPTPTPSLTPSPKPTKPTPTPERPSWPTPAPAPAGFEAVFGIAGLLVVTVYLIIRRKR